MTTTETNHQMHSRVTDQMRRQYQDEGYFILERALSAEQLELLRSGAQHAVDQLDARMDAEGVDQISIASRGKRYFAQSMSSELPELRRVLFSDLMAEICRATLGPDAYLFWEQYVIKAGDPDTTFAWHQDSGYVHENHQRYLTLWIALDDVTEENGSVYLLPYSRSGIRSYIKHIRDERVNDQVCYFGADPGIPIIVPAGSIAVFSSFVIHRSGANRTDRMRRVFTTSYSSEIITTADGARPWGQAEQFLRGGEIVAVP